MSQERFRSLVGAVLTVGVTISASLMLIGFAASFLVGWEGSLTGAATGAGRVTDFTSLGAELRAVRPVGLVQLGLLVLVGTPVARVAASVVGFLLEGDRLYAAITVIVLGVLLVSLFVLR